MMLARIEPDKPGHDKRTFECPECQHIEIALMKQLGTIAQWRPEKSFGFIVPDDPGDEIFVHASSMVMNFDPAVGQRVTFEVEKSLRDGKLRAIRVALA